MTSVLGMFGSGSQGRTTQMMAKENAKTIKRQMSYQTQKSKEQIADIEEKTIAIKSAQRAKIGASGVMLEGSPAESIIETERRANKAINNIQYWDRINQYEALREARFTKSAGNYAFVNGMLSSGGQATAYGVKIANSFSSGTSGGTEGMKTKNPATGETTTTSSGWSFDWSVLWQ